jgi:tetratricopeptide (TPR) repeat protein
VLVADRYSYLSMLGWALVLGGAAAALLRSGRRILATAGLAVAALGLASWGFLARTYADAWESPESLWRLAVDADPACAQCRGHLGLALAATGRLAQAERECRLAAALRPDRADHHAFLASVLERQGRLDSALAAWAGAASRHLRYGVEARRVRGMVLATGGRHAEAARELRAAYLEAPSDRLATELVQVLKALANDHARGGRLDDALRILEEARRIQPGEPLAPATLGALRDPGAPPTRSR